MFLQSIQLSIESDKTYFKNLTNFSFTFLQVSLINTFDPRLMLQ